MFQRGGIFHRKGPKLEKFNDGFGPPLLHTTIPWKKISSMPKTQGKQGTKRKNSSKLASHPAMPLTGNMGLPMLAEGGGAGLGMTVVATYVFEREWLAGEG